MGTGPKQVDLRQYYDQVALPSFLVVLGGVLYVLFATTDLNTRSVGRVARQLGSILEGQMAPMMPLDDGADEGGDQGLPPRISPPGTPAAASAPAPAANSRPAPAANSRPAASTPVPAGGGRRRRREN
jgi:hypothetical protein